MGKSGSARGGCQSHATGNKHFFPVMGGKNVVYECRDSWETGLMSDIQVVYANSKLLLHANSVVELMHHVVNT